MTRIANLHDSLRAQLRSLEHSNGATSISAVGHQLEAARAKVNAARGHLEAAVEPADVDDARAVVADARALLRRFDAASRQSSAGPALRDNVRHMGAATNQLERTIIRLDAEFAAWARNAPHRPIGNDFAAG